MHVAARQHWRCRACERELDASHETDHVVPLYHGGTHTLANLQALCRPCHYFKTRDDEASVRPSTLLCLHCGEVVSPHFTHAVECVAYDRRRRALTSRPPPPRPPRGRWGR